MKKSNRVLQDHKKVGTKLIPPLKQLQNMKEVSFADNGLPNLIWISALFQNLKSKDAINLGCEFIKKIHEIENLPNHNFVNLSNFLLLDDECKHRINITLDKRLKADLFEGVKHINFLFENFPLSFLFKDFENTMDRVIAIEKLKLDVRELLDRRTYHATKVQVTAIFLMMVARKLDVPESIISNEDFDSIFLNPTGEKARRVASFARASLNGNIGVDHNVNSIWSKNFWYKSFFLDGCKKIG